MIDEELDEGSNKVNLIKQYSEYLLKDKFQECEVVGYHKKTLNA